MGFYSNDLPVDTLENLEEKLYKRSKAVRYIIRDQSLEKYERVKATLPELRTLVSQYFSLLMTIATGQCTIMSVTGKYLGSNRNIASSVF